MNEKIYTILPGMPEWKFEASGYGDSTLSCLGTGFRMTPDTPAQEIIDQIKKIMRYRTFTPDEVAIEAIAQASRNIDWKAAIAKPIPDLIAPLIIAEPTSASPEMIPSEILDKIYKDMETAYYAIKAFDPRTKK